MTIQRLEWTTEPPTQDGWYWTVEANDIFIVEVSKIGSRMIVNYFGTLEESRVDEFTYWLGPLPIPDPPK